MPEEFYPIEGFNDNYEITKSGIVRRKSTGYLLKRSINNRGYYCVVISGLTTTKHRSGRALLHYLLAKTFIPNPENKRTVNHKDGNKLNCALDNLEWNTDKENINHAFDNNLNAHSDKHYLSKLTNTQVLEIRQHGLNKVFKHRELADMYGVHQSTITDVINKRVYKRVK